MQSKYQKQAQAEMEQYKLDVLALLQAANEFERLSKFLESKGFDTWFVTGDLSPEQHLDEANEMIATAAMHRAIEMEEKV